MASFALPATCVENPSAYASLNNTAIVGWIMSIAGKGSAKKKQD